jgi:glyoxylase-like metal-dependent hydrolase (beta-lactamase superfamily II)
VSRVTEVVAGVHRFGHGGINFYIIASDDGLTVVDAGLPGHWTRFATWLHRNGRAPRDVRAVLLTHHHADHIGFADRAQHAGAALRIHEDDLAVLGGSPGAGIPTRFVRNAWRPLVIARVAGWVRMGAARTPTLADVVSCSDGDRLDVPGAPRVVHVPGHTPGSAAYVFDDHGVVCTGDALVTEDPATGRQGLGISPTGLNADDDQALASLDRLADVDAPVLLPGHGAPYHYGVASALHAARAIGPNW